MIMCYFPTYKDIGAYCTAIALLIYNLGTILILYGNCLANLQFGDNTWDNCSGIIFRNM